MIFLSDFSKYKYFIKKSEIYLININHKLFKHIIMFLFVKIRQKIINFLLFYMILYLLKKLYIDEI